LRLLAREEFDREVTTLLPFVKSFNRSTIDIKEVRLYNFLITFKKYKNERIIKRFKVYKG